MSGHWQAYIQVRPGVMLGKPVFRGTRLTVDHVIRDLATGASADELLDHYPNLRPEHLRDAPGCAADVPAMDWAVEP